MITEKLAQLVELKAKVAELEQQAAVAINAELAALPVRYGFPDVKSFLSAVSTASGGRRSRRGRPRKRAWGRGRVGSVTKRVSQRDRRSKESRGAQKPSVYRKSTDKPAPKNTHGIADSGFVREVRAALIELEAGKSMSGRRRLRRAAKLKP